MSQLITLDVQDGIVMAADSRITYSDKAPFYSDSSEKLFYTKSGVGISTCGDATIDGERIQIPLKAFIERYDNDDVNTVANSILPYFKALDNGLDTVFHVAGYQCSEKKVYRVLTKKDKVSSCEHSPACGLIWNGDNYVINRLLNPYFIKTRSGQPGDLEKYRQVPWNNFLVQDAIDFAVFMIETAAKFSIFHQEERTIGGDIDVLVLRRDSAVWYAHKELHL